MTSMTSQSDMRRSGEILDIPLKGKGSMSMMAQYFTHQQELEKKYGKKSLVLIHKSFHLTITQNYVH